MTPLAMALHKAQVGGKHPLAKPLKGFSGAGVLYVLHAFQKKAKKGIETPKHEIDLVKSRLAMAEADYRQREKGTEQ